jgi:Chaperone of endosialidase
MRIRVLVLLLASLMSGAAFAQTSAPSTSVPRVVRLDGQLVPANGLPPSAVETVTLSIYASQTDATPLWSETQDVRVDAQGRYAVLLGASTAEGIPAAVLSGEARWLGIRFARPGEVEQPRVPMTSVPYALRASDADTLGGLPPTAFLRAPDASGAARAAGTTAAAADRTTPPLVSTGTANYIGKFTNSVDLTNSVLFENASRIGLGTTTPLDFLHTRFTDTTGSFTGLAVQNLGNSATSYSGMLFYDHTGALGQFQGFNNSTKEYRINNIATGGTINFMIGGTSRFQVRNDGDVDISGSIRKAGTLLLHTRGVRNIGVGRLALGASTDAQSSLDNVAIGENAMESLTSGGGGNNAVGRLALRSITSGIGNNAMGYVALRDSTGSFNLAVGDFTATEKVTGDSNIYIGNNVANSVANTESSTIRFGDAGGYSRFFAGGIRGVTTGVADAVAVVIDGNGQLGTINSSRRYKEDIQDMGEASSRLMQLRPVTYRYTQAFADGRKPLDYGLIAEEVEQVYPDLVAHLKNGEVETVQYHKINAMLLNEVQKQHRQIGDQQRELTDLKARLAALERLLGSEKQ